MERIKVGDVVHTISMYELSRTLDDAQTFLSELASIYGGNARLAYERDRHDDFYEFNVIVDRLENDAEFEKRCKQIECWEQRERAELARLLEKFKDDNS